MEVIWYLLTIIVSSEAAHKEYYPWKRTQLSAVTHFPGFKDFYINEMRLQRSRSLQAERHYPKITTEVKKVLCNKILNNHSKVQNEFWLNTELHGVVDDLKTKERNVYEQIFTPRPPEHRSSNWMGCISCSVDPFERVYVNPYVVIDALVDGKPVQEYVFKCLARDREDKTLKQYYISEEYNVNVRRTKLNNMEPPFITGRFVFTQNVKEEWVLHEMAEETAILTRLSSSDRHQYEKFYLKSRQGQSIAVDPEHDPVCGLTEGLKLRLCVAMINTVKITGSGSTPQFEQKYNNLEPFTQEVDHVCEKRKVLFLNPDISKDSSVEEHEEWTIACIVKTRQKSEETFLVSRGYHLNSIFVFQPAEGGGMVVDHHSYNVSVVDDPAIQLKRTGSKKIEY